MNKKVLSLAVLVSFLSSCGTVFTSGKQDMSFDSNVGGVEIFINGEARCKTPCVTKVSRSRDAMLVVAKKDGFDDKVINTHAGINLVSLFNILSTTGFTTDVATGYMWEYQPNAYYVIMDPEPKTPQEKKLRDTENKVRKFALENHSDIMSDVLYDGRKDYVIALSKMSGLDLSEIENIARLSKDEPSFTGMIVEAMRKKY